ncbi:MAG: polysulfide reductase NrfD [Burkholderiales bacterium]|nr:polysulfide reductase NrfD [Burkholderiales bacterium]
MLEITRTRHNPLVDPLLEVWSWQIPLYLFVGGVVAGMMVLAGAAMLRLARGDDGRRFFSMQTPLLGFVLLNVGMLALLLDLTHRLYVWRIFTTFQFHSPMAWGSWLLIVVYGVLLVSALIRLPEAWPWLGGALPPLAAWSEALVTRPARLRALAGINIALGIGLGIYTGILLDTMVARPLWNTAILAPLFLFSGLSAGAATLHLAAALRGDRPAPRGALGGAFAALIQPLGREAPAAHTVDTLIRWDLGFLVVEGLLIALMLLNLQTSSASHAAAAALLTSGPYALAFWGLVVGLGLLVPIAWQALELGHRVAHTVLPALLVLIGGFALRWVMVNAGQLSHVVAAAAG